MMTTKEQLLEELETLPEELISEALDYICFIKNRYSLKLEAIRAIAKLDSDWWENLNNFTPDFLDERSQPNLPNREDIF